MIRWLVLAFLVSSSQASRPRGIRAEVICYPVTSFTPKLKKSQIIHDAIEHLLILLTYQIVCGKLLRVFVCRLLHCTTRVQISDVLTAATRFPSYKSMTTTVIVRWENISWHFHPLSLKWLGWVRWARHLCLSQWKILLRECWAQGHGHSLRQGEWKFSGFKQCCW